MNDLAVFYGNFLITVRVGFNNCAPRREQTNQSPMSELPTELRLSAVSDVLQDDGSFTAAKKSKGRAKMSHAIRFLFSCGNLAFQL
jgi:hypothetical protein